MPTSGKLFLTEDQIQALHEAMKFLAGRDRDRATEINRRGFSAADTIIGHRLAEKPFLTYAEAITAFRLAYRYRKQLPVKLKRIIFKKKKKKKRRFFR